VANGLIVNCTKDGAQMTTALGSPSAPSMCVCLYTKIDAFEAVIPTDIPSVRDTNGAERRQS
jgi:hypothetical protein